MPAPHLVFPASAAVAAPSAPRTQYEEEIGYEVYSASIVEVKNWDLGEDATEFKIVSRRAVPEADATKGGRRDSNVSVGSDGQLHVKQEVWKSYADFKALSVGLERPAAYRPSVEFPRSGSWFPAGFGFGISRSDNAETRRALLENYIQAALASSSSASAAEVPSSSGAAAGTPKVLLNFLRPAERPDWPACDGSKIDLSVHDLPHASSQTEWWYYNTHFEDEEGRKYSAFAAFFRVVKHTDRGTGKKSYAHALNWAITDVTEKKYYQTIVLDRDSPAIIKKQLEQGAIKDGRLRIAYEEVLNAGNVPLPDRMFSPGRDAVCETSRLHVDLERASVHKNEDGEYVLSCSSDNGLSACDLVFTPRKAPVRHGLDGVVKGHDGDDMFYYCISRCDVSGTFTVGGRRLKAVKGQGWYDHEFGGKAPENEDVPIMNYAWNWAAVQLDNGYEVSVATLVDPRTKPQTLMETRAIVIDPSGGRSQPGDLVFEGAREWTSVRTFNSYPTRWEVGLASAGLQLTLDASFEDQEFMTLIARPGFWEGRVEVTGTMHGAPVRGVGYVERNGFQSLSELDAFFKAVGEATRKAVLEVYPDNVTRETAIALIATPETPWYVDGVDLELFREGIVAPVRYIVDQGGKSWRSYGALACMEVVGGDCRNYVRWLSMPEFMHVGSLIIDDIEDNSLKRRGADCAHIKYGMPVAINSGTAAYFQGQQMLLVPGLTAAQMNRIYDYYFAALRAGHAGQALDIAGLDSIMDDVIENGRAGLAEERITAIHRLKTAVPAASLARMGALVGGGSDAQIDAIGHYYEAIGIAFQIMDDVLNLRGLVSGKADKTSNVVLKTVGEDIMEGKVTFPVVKAIGILAKRGEAGKAQMKAIWNVIKARTKDASVVAGVIAQLEEMGAIHACELHSYDLVDSAFEKLTKVVPDSFSKIMLRAFGYFVTERKR